MKRSSFIKMSVAVGSTIAMPFAGFAKRKENNRNKEPFKVDAGKDRFDKPINLFGGDTFILRYYKRYGWRFICLRIKPRRRGDRLCIFITAG